MNPIGERSCYDEGKRAAETLTFDYKREHGLEVTVLVCTDLCFSVILDSKRILIVKRPLVHQLRPR